MTAAMERVRWWIMGDGLVKVIFTCLGLVENRAMTADYRLNLGCRQPYNVSFKVFSVCFQRLRVNFKRIFRVYAIFISDCIQDLDILSKLCECVLVVYESFHSNFRVF